MADSAHPAGACDVDRGAIADVLVPVAVDTAYSYRVPSDCALAPGDVVGVPLGTREAIGVVWALRADQGGGGNLKAVTGRIDMPPLPETVRRFVDWIAAYTLSPRGMVLRMALRDPEQVMPERPRVGVRLTGNHPGAITPARGRVIRAAQGGIAWPRGALAKAAGVSAGVVDALVDAEVLEAVVLPPEPIAPMPDADHAPPLLSATQGAVATALRGAVDARAFGVHLLDGVTGSGKTEVYFEAVAEAVRQGRQSLILLPEIALTAQFTARFEKRFGVRPGEWHSGVGPGRKGRLWRAVADGSARVVAGARSALFLPFADLGLIVVDEEHDQAYRQEDGVLYHARDMAVVRARLSSAPVILASATPAIESRVNAQQGRYRHHRLPARHGARPLPRLKAIDLKAAGPPRGQWLAPALLGAVSETLAAGQQSLLFLNRRGYAPLTVCRACGHRWQCPRCSTSLVEHRFRRALMCHACGHVEGTPRACVACGTQDAIAPVGPGVERLAEEVAQRFPDARRIVLSSDSFGGPERLRRELEAVADGAYAIIIGTQIVAKGHDFPNLTLVGVVDADMSLRNGDPRAAERTFQVLQQVTGRAGRGAAPGRGLIQTHDPGHPVIQAILSGDPERFYAEEIAMRQAAMLPPFGRLAALIVSGADRTETEVQARALAQAGHSLLADPPDGARFDGLMLLGPAEAPIALIRGRHRFRLLVQGPRDIDMQGFVRALIAAAPKLRGSLRVVVDVDPMSFV
jgi:primosomal protein N' (replication factor Y)